MCKKLSVVACLVLVVAGSLWGQRSLAAQVGLPPVDVTGAFDIAANSFGSGVCAFDIRISFSGKAGTIQFPGGRTIITSPKLSATVTNLSDPTKNVTLSITGAFHQSVQNGQLIRVLTGRNLVFNPLDGIVLTIGTFTSVFNDPNGNPILPLNGKGQIIDICNLIA